MQTAVNHLTNC